MLTVEEWNAVHSAYIKKESDRIRGDWDLMRVHAFLELQPDLDKNARRTCTPQKIWPMPWDDEKKESKNIVSRDIQEERYKRLLERTKDAGRQSEDRCDEGGEGTDTAGHVADHQEGDHHEEGEV